MKTLRFLGLLMAVVLSSVTLSFAQGSDHDSGNAPDARHSHAIDSLLSIFYIQRAMGDSISYPDMDSIDVPIADLPDAIYMERLAKLASPIHLSYNQTVRNCIIAYTQKWKRHSESILGLADYYMPMIEETFDQEGVPLELRAMAVIESALNPTAVSRAGATGMWQFMFRTGKHYDLNVTSFVDDRCDPVISARAAARYLRDLYSIFGDWTLAIAAYNCGDGNVRKAIRRAGGKTDYWEIYPYLPRETRGYVPLFIGATYMLNYYKEHKMIPVKTEKPIQTDTIMVSKMLHFEQIAAVTGISMDELRDLNPQYRRDIIPGKEKSYVLTLPYKYTSQFIDKEQEIYAYKDSVYFNPKMLTAPAGLDNATTDGKGKVTYKVVKGDTPGSIAKRYGVSLTNLKNWNNLGNKSIIRVGQKLVIYTNKKK